MATATKPSADIAFLCRALKAPSLAAAVDRLGERARSEGWSHEEFLAACLEREVAARAEVVNLKGDSYRPKDRDLGRVPTDDNA